MATRASSGPQVTTVDGVIDRMRSIDQALPTADGLACFNRMYIQVTEAIRRELEQSTFDDAAFMTRLDVVFANLYLEAADAAEASTAVPTAWRPLIDRRADAGIEPIQFALAGMNAHINNDLPLAVVATCEALGTAPTDGSHHDDYQKVDQLLDAAERSIRQSFENEVELAVDRHAQAVLNVVDAWSINEARDVAWDNALALWELRGLGFARQGFVDGLAAVVAMASRSLLVAV